MPKLEEIQLDLVPQSGRWRPRRSRHENRERALKGVDGMSPIAGTKIRPPQGVQIRGIGAVRERDSALRQLDGACRLAQILRLTPDLLAKQLVDSHGQEDDAHAAPADFADDLKSQAMDAILGHAQATLTPTDAEIQSIVSFETALFTAQARDDKAGSLHAQGATGGPRELSQQAFFIGINDPLGGNPTGAAFDPRAFTLFDRWMRSKRDSGDERTDARAAIARGETLFNARPIVIAGVAGLNDNPAVGPTFSGTCTTCHDTPNSGNHSVSAPLNIGLADVSRRTPDLPLYTLRNKITGDEIQTSDPGRAMISGKWKDVGKFKGPILRGLAGRAPYFHNGSAATIAEAVDFYDTRFALGLTNHEKSDLIAFLLTL